LQKKQTGNIVNMNKLNIFSTLQKNK
jgi:hypothetical protein